MTTLSWDETTKRLFKTGLDRGVLYIEDNRGVSWSGLVSIEESIDENTITTYLDGAKVAERYSKSDFKATITAFTFPDEFIQYQGIDYIEDSGMSISGQTASTFCLAYRTLIGNDIEGSEFGYQIHILYNLVAEVKDFMYSTISSNPEAVTFSWTISGTPAFVSDFYPTSHVIIDSRFISADLLVFIEDLLYGVARPTSSILPAEVNNQKPTKTILSAEILDDFDYYEEIEPYQIIPNEFNATLPDLETLTSLVTYFDPKRIQENSETGFSTLSSGYGDITNTKVDGVFQLLPKTRLVPVYKDIYYTLEP